VSALIAIEQLVSLGTARQSMNFRPMLSSHFYQDTILPRH
jgi:hypothetical protein